jgi:hypothetical protein
MHVTFWVAVTAWLTKIGDLILDSHQQAQLQKACNALTLWLIDLQILKWYPRLSEYKVNIPVFLFILAAELASGFYKGKQVTPRAALLFAAFQWPVFLAIVTFLSKRQTPLRFCLWAVSLWFAAWACMIFSIAVGVVWGGTFVNLYRTSPDLLINNFKAVTASFSVAIFLFALGLCTAALTAVLCLMWLAAFVCYLLVATARQFMWRVATYAKGAWAALCLLAAPLMAVIEFMVNQ